MTVTTWHCCKLEVSLIREAQRTGRPSGMLTWTWNSGQATLLYTLLVHQDRESLVYTWDSGPSGKHVKGYLLTWDVVPTALGIDRQYWNCPTCGRHVTVLYMPRGNRDWEGHDYFACRHCYKLPYGTQYESATARMWREDREAWKVVRDPKSRGPQLGAAFRALGRTEAWRDAFSVATRVHWARVKHVLDRPARRPGRPSKRQLREERRQRREAERAEWPLRPVGRPREKRDYVRRVPLPVLSERTSTMQAYCPKCRDRREMLRPVPVTFKNGRPAMQGACAACGCRMARLVPRDEDRRDSTA